MSKNGSSEGKQNPEAPQKEPFFRKRLAELLGLGFVLIAGVFTALLATRNPVDPTLWRTSDIPAENALGILGATLAEIFFGAVGYAIWAVPLALFVWGGRLIAHRYNLAILTRALFVPVWIACLAVFAAGIPPMGAHVPNVGLGGELGDAVMSPIMGMLPMGLKMAAILVSVLAFLVSLGVGAVALGMNPRELRGASRFMRTGAGLVIGGGAIMAGKLSKRKSKDEYQEDLPPVEVLSTEIPEGADTAEDKPLTSRITAAMLSAKTSAPENETAETDARIEPAFTPAPAEPEPEQVSAADEAFDEPETPRSVVQPRRVVDVPKSKQAIAERQPSLDLEPSEGAFDKPPLGLLENHADLVTEQLSDEALEENARLLEQTLEDYGIRGEIVSVRPGPVVTMYELEPAPGTKASRVIGLADDIARSMSALAARVSTVPGRNIIGIELPNDTREKVLLREILSARAYGDSSHALPLALGKDIGGEPVVANLAKMPHLLIAGTTGSGKSVAINTMILSLLYRLTPDQCRLIMIDPKMLELSVYDGIPHLLSPVVTDPKKAVVALKWVVAEMEERYHKMSRLGVRNIDGYNARVSDALEKGEAFERTVQTGFDEDTGAPVFETESFAPEKLPYIVVIVDEMADLMMVAGKEIEACIQRLAQMARASGIHLIMATQRPSVDVITGTIKANFPTRISFQVTSKIDSRTILGEQGAEQLLGMGDMLYMAGGGRITRVHGPFASDLEVEEVVNHLKLQGAPDYVSGVIEGPDEETEQTLNQVMGLGGNTNGEDALYDQAVAIVARDRKCSTSYIQRKLAIGYNKAARLVEQMEDQGVVGPANKVGKRDILIPEA